MPVSVGDRVPSVGTLRVLNDKGSPTPVDLEQTLAGKKVVMFGVPGAFTPPCSQSHLPGYVVGYDELIAKGVDQIICVSVNDAWTMGAWGKMQNANNIMMLADGSGDLTAALGLTKNLNKIGLGSRSARYAMIIDDGVISYIGIERGPEITVSSAEAVLAEL